MAVKTTAWQAEDKSLHLTEEAAKDQDFRAAFKAWMAEHFEPDHAPCGLSLVEAIDADRMKLVGVFKKLNGGNPLTVPAMQAGADKVVALPGAGTQQAAQPQGTQQPWNGLP